MKKLLMATISVLLPFILSASTIARQTIRGHVCDIASGEPMAGVAIVIDADSSTYALTDVDGNFVIEGVAVGRHTVLASIMGYEPLELKEQLLSSGKEMVLDLKMTESVTLLQGALVRPKVNKQLPLNDMAQVGARMFSVEEANRYAGGLADPARTASVFAGVVGGGASNGISIHGNSPAMLQWRVEGVEVNNPNHFADITGAGGGIFSSLNGSVLANSDFMTGAMPAEYGNALSGAFDMQMRVGNNAKYEHAFQFGLLGIDFASEGPIGKAREGVARASYLVNYRYSFLSVAKKIHAINMEKETLDYQDLSFKFNFPTRKAGTFSLWFTGLIDNYEAGVSDRSEWETLWDMNESWSNQRNWGGGLKHNIRFCNGGTLTSSVSCTGTYMKVGVNDYDEQMSKVPAMDGRNCFFNLVFSVIHKQKFNSRYNMQNGIEHTHMEYNARMDRVAQTYGPLFRIYEGDGLTGQTRVFTNHKVSVTDRLSFVAGANATWFHLTDQFLVEPRISTQYKLSKTASLAIAYGLNSRRESLDTYFVTKPGETNPEPNSNLGLTRSHHISASFSKRLGENALFKVEPYWQYLFDVPVTPEGTMSNINNTNFFKSDALVNEGRGRNYGIDFTLERYLNDGYYGMITGSLFKSEFRDAEGGWHHTRYDRRYVANILGGKEWMVGRKKDNANVLSVNFRVTLAGGDRYTPLTEGVTFEDVMMNPDKIVPENNADPFSEQMKMNVSYAFSAKYTVNARRVSHSFLIDFLKIRSFQGKTFDLRTHETVDKFTEIAFPNIAYRLEF